MYNSVYDGWQVILLKKRIDMDNNYKLMFTCYHKIPIFLKPGTYIPKVGFAKQCWQKPYAETILILKESIT
jgi:hypothetical protein